METLQIKSTTQTPEIFCDGSAGHFSISGKSYPDNVNSVYDPVMKYLNAYSEQPATNTVMEFNWLYYNTATSKIIVKIIRLLQEMGTRFEIRWHYTESATIIHEKGKELANILGVDMKFISAGNE